MAYLHSRSGIARSGVTHCGWTPPAFRVYIDGTDRTSNVLLETCSITVTADQPATFAFTVKNITPNFGNDVKVAFAAPNDYWFAGTLLQMQIQYLDATNVLYNCLATGYEWLLDRYDRVMAQYTNRAVNHIVADILARFTDGGAQDFRVGYCPSSLGNLTMNFTYETVLGALKRIAKATGAQLDIAFDRAVNVYLTYPDAAYATLTNSLILLETVRVDYDLSQVRTRVLMQGRGSTATEAREVGATTLAVADTQPFSASGGSAVIGRNQITYTGLTTNSGAGLLTGVTGLDYDIAQDEAVDVLAIATDGGLNALLAILLGGSLSGQATHYLQDGRLSLSEATARAAADLDNYGEVLTLCSFTYRNYVRHLKVGRQLASTTPVNGTFVIRSIQIQPYGNIANTEFLQHVSMGPRTIQLADILGDR